MTTQASEGSQSGEQSRPPGPGGGGPGGPRPGGGGDRNRGGDRDQGGRPGGRRYFPRRKVCFFCANKDTVIDYKIVEGLRRYVSERGRIEPRRKTGTCAKHQRTLSNQIKRARQVGLLAFTTDRTPNPTPVTRDR
jgi:small subunit ribosomal protein S18